MIWATMVADIGRWTKHTLPVLDELPTQTVLALYQQAGRLRRESMRDAALMSGNPVAMQIFGGFDE